jgi:hypothetical protein
MLTKTEEPLSNEPVTADFNDTEKAFQEAEKRLDVVKQVMTKLNNQFYPIESKRIYIEKNFIDIKDDLDLVEKNIRVINEINSAEAPQNLKLRLEELERGLSMCKRDYEKLSTDFSKEVPSNKNQPPQENTFTSILKKFDQFKQKEGQDLQEKYTSALKESNRALTESTSVLKQLSELEPSSKNYSNYRRWKPVLEKKVTDVENKIEAIQNTDFKGDLKKATSFIVKNRESLEFEKELLKLMLAVDGYPKNIDDKDKPEIKDVKQKTQAVINEILAIKNGNRRPIKGEVPTKDLIEVLKSTNQLFTDPQHAGKYKLEAVALQRKSVGMRILGALMMALSVAVLAVGISLVLTNIGLIASVAASALIFGSGVKLYQTESNKLDLVNAVRKLADATILWPLSEAEVEDQLEKNPASQAPVMEEVQPTVDTNLTIEGSQRLAMAGSQQALETSLVGPQQAVNAPYTSTSEIQGLGRYNGPQYQSAAHINIMEEYPVVHQGAIVNRVKAEVVPGIRVDELLREAFLKTVQDLANEQESLKLFSPDTNDLISKIIEQIANFDFDNENNQEGMAELLDQLGDKLIDMLSKLDPGEPEANQAEITKAQEHVQRFIARIERLDPKESLGQIPGLSKAAQELSSALAGLIALTNKSVKLPELSSGIDNNIKDIQENLNPDATEKFNNSIEQFNENINGPKVAVVKNAAEAFKAAQGLTHKLSEKCQGLMSEIKKKFPNVDELLENSKRENITYLRLAFDFSQRGFLTLCSKLFDTIRDELSLPNPGTQADQRSAKWRNLAQESNREYTPANTVDITKPNSEDPLDAVQEGHEERRSFSI